ncbi:uncharacterized protein KGF55_002223 [Candida pseudojiufengensis]|uniref:uncharacterized protein n=1 Tax=Candida pseudojiufengensis TaxID=497109 RepID=UPI002225A84F|nr:uncharacterized protein KGF55_002223 [Candida pseudojiufengensis]KAI5964281.1 hypothetical protein KGF55_002223 [Candida pseudojiufengensis]
MMSELQQDQITSITKTHIEKIFEINSKLQTTKEDTARHEQLLNDLKFHNNEWLQKCDESISKLLNEEEPQQQKEVSRNEEMQLYEYYQNKNSSSSENSSVGDLEQYFDAMNSLEFTHKRLNQVKTKLSKKQVTFKESEIYEPPMIQKLIEILSNLIDFVTSITDMIQNGISNGFNFIVNSLDEFFIQNAIKFGVGISDSFEVFFSKNNQILSMVNDVGNLVTFK